MAHIGVIRALDEASIPIDLIGGTSAGGLVAAQHAMGHGPAEIGERTHKAFVEHDPFHSYTIPIVSIVGERRMQEMSADLFGDVLIEDLWTPFFCVSCNISTTETVVHRSGLVREAARATSALPGIAVPVVRNGHLLVDGGVVDNLPGTTARALSGGHVILVDVSPEQDLLVDSDSLPRAGEILWSWMAPHKESLQVPTIGDVIVRTLVLSSVKRREEARELGILVLRPPVQPFGMLEFTSFKAIVEAGYRDATERIAEWPERAQYAEPAAT